MTYPLPTLPTPGHARTSQLRSTAARLPVIAPVEDVAPEVDVAPEADAPEAASALNLVEFLDGRAYADYAEADRAARAQRQARHMADISHMAQLIEDMLDEVGATSADRRAIAEHLSGRTRLEAGEADHDSWKVTTALAQAWQAYAQRTHLSAGVLLSVLDGACDMVTDYIDVETATTILQITYPEVTGEEVVEFIHWLERGDVWDDAMGDARLRSAWSRYRDAHDQSAGAA